MMRYLNGTQEKVLTIKAESMSVIKWFSDTSFDVHEDFKSHTGGIMTLGTGAAQAVSSKQKLNARSSTESELVAVVYNGPMDKAFPERARV